MAKDDSISGCLIYVVKYLLGDKREYEGCCQLPTMAYNAVINTFLFKHFISTPLGKYRSTVVVLFFVEPFQALGREDQSLLGVVLRQSLLTQRKGKFSLPYIPSKNI